MNQTFPELESQRDFIQKMVGLEEQRFSTTLTVGLSKLDELFSATGDAMPQFNQLARLYDTFGIPRDLIRVALEERGFDVPEDQFNKQFDEAIRQLQLSGTNSEGTAAKKVNEVYGEIAERGRSQFRGYETTTVDDARVVSLIKENANVSALETGEAGEVVLDHTPFYAESGGQVGDVGRFVRTTAGTNLDQANSSASSGGSDLIAIVVDTYSPAQGLIVHKVVVEKGTITVGDTVSAEVDVEKRDATRRNHTATHLMHAALAKCWHARQTSRLGGRSGLSAFRLHPLSTADSSSNRRDRTFSQLSHPAQ